MESIATYIASDSPIYAKAVVKKIVALTRNLSTFPKAGRQVPEFDDDAGTDRLQLQNHLSSQRI